MSRESNADILRRAQEVIDPLAEARAVAERYDELPNADDTREVITKADDLRRRAERARMLAELQQIRAKLRASGEGHLYRAGKLLEGREEHERLPDHQYSQFRKAVSAAATDHALERELAELEEREQVRVVAESGPYEEGSPHSWIRDTLVHRDPEAGWALAGWSGESDMRQQAVEERLRRHGVDVVRALVKRDHYGKLVARMLREQNRQEDIEQHRRLYSERVRELRAGLTTGGGATAAASGGGGAAFVAPAFLMDSVWATYRSPYRSFVDQCRSDIPLPAYGMEVYLTVVSGGASVATDVELAGVSEIDPTTGFASSQVVTKAGQIAVTQQWLDRAGPGISGEKVLFEQVKEQLDAQVDVYAIQQAVANAQTVTDSSAFSLATASGSGGFYKDVKAARNLLHDTAGVRLRATHLFAVGDFCDYLASLADGGGRPIFAPHFDDNRLPLRAGTGNDSGGAEGYTGFNVAGLFLFADDNIPASGSNLQLIITKPSTILQLEGTPVPYLYPESFAGNLEAVFGMRQYVATIARYPSGVATISGSAYAPSTFA